MQDRTYVPLRAGRHLRVHGVVTNKRRARETEQVFREEEHRKTCETCQARGWFSADPSSTEQDYYRATRERCQSTGCTLRFQSNRSGREYDSRATSEMCQTTR